MIRRVTRAVMIGAGLALVICTGAPGALPRVAHAQPSGAGPTVTIDTFQFKPREIEVREGTKVVWTNEDDVQHTVTSGTPDARSDMFNAAMNGKNAKFEFTFTKAGRYPFFCNRHQHMRGEIVVKAP